MACPPTQRGPLAAPLRARAERVDRLPLARVDPRRAPAEADRRRRGRRRHLEPDDLPEGDDRRRRLRRAAARARPPGGDADQDVFWALAEQDIGDACDLFRPVWDGGGGRDGYVSLEVDPRPGLRHARDLPRGDAPARGGRPAQPDGQDPRDQARASRRSRTSIAKGRSINVTLIFSLRRYAEVAESYMRGLERLVAEGGDPSEGRLGRELLRLAHRHRGRQAPGGDRRPRRAARASSRSPTRSSPTRTTRRSSPGRAGSTCSARARRRSACCGRRPRRRTPTTPTRMYVEELIGADTVNTMPEETIRAYQDHGEPEPRLETGLDEARSACSSELARGRRRLRRRHRHARARGRGEIRGVLRRADRRAARKRESLARLSGRGRVPVARLQRLRSGVGDRDQHA